VDCRFEPGVPGITRRPVAQDQTDETGGGKVQLLAPAEEAMGGFEEYFGDLKDPAILPGSDGGG
jgi:hypothetical protein